MARLPVGPRACCGWRTSACEFLAAWSTSRNAPSPRPAWKGEWTNSGTVRFPTPKTYDDLIAELVKHARQLIPRRDKSGALAMGLSVPGLIDRRQQQILLSSNLHFLDGRFLASDLQKKLGFRTILLHDTDALCLSQRTFGPARAMDDFALVDATAGLGGAVMTGGRLISGHSGMAGEIGHITVDPKGRRCGCGNIGCLETLADDSALATLISERIGKTIDIESVIQLAQAGELDVDPELQQTIEYLAIAVAAVVNIFNPSAVFVQARHVRHPRRFVRRPVGSRSAPSAGAIVRRLPGIPGRGRQVAKRRGGNHSSFDDSAGAQGVRSAVARRKWKLFACFAGRRPRVS